MSCQVVYIHQTRYNGFWAVIEQFGWGHCDQVHLFVVNKAAFFSYQWGCGQIFRIYVQLK